MLLHPFEYQLNRRRLFELINGRNYREVCLNSFLLSVNLSLDDDKSSQCIS